MIKLRKLLSFPAFSAAVVVSKRSLYIAFCFLNDTRRKKTLRLKTQQQNEEE
jgi:hypothetical protein